MPRTVVAALLAIAMLLPMACSSGGGGTPGQPADPVAAPEGEDEGDDVETVTATPEAQLEGACEPLPQEDAKGKYLVADLVVRNTGNIGIDVRVVAAWRQPGRRSVTAVKRLRLDLDESAPVRMRIDIGDAEARDIERMVKRDRPCGTRVRISGAFGSPRQ